MAKCPVCKNKSSNDIKILPFCSSRCKSIDLYKWFSGNYSVLVVEYDDINEEELEKLNSMEESKDRF